MPYGNKMSAEAQDVILSKLGEIAQELNPAGMDKKASLSIADKERHVTALLQDPTGRGFKRVA